MIELPRRRFLAGLGALIAAPAIVRVASIMPVSVKLQRLRSSFLRLSGVSTQHLGGGTYNVSWMDQPLSVEPDTDLFAEMARALVHAPERYFRQGGSLRFEVSADVRRAMDVQAMRDIRVLIQAVSLDQPNPGWLTKYRGVPIEVIDAP